MIICDFYERGCGLGSDQAKRVPSEWSHVLAGESPIVIPGTLYLIHKWRSGVSISLEGCYVDISLQIESLAALKTEISIRLLQLRYAPCSMRYAVF